MAEVFLGWEKEGGIFRMGYSSHYSSNPTSPVSTSSWWGRVDGAGEGGVAPNYLGWELGRAPSAE